MNITGNLENGVLTIGMEGRIDTTNAAQAEEEIQKLEAQDHGKVVLDAEKLEYISSAGLRVILRLRKQELQEEQARSAAGRSGKPRRRPHALEAVLTFLRNDATRMGALRFSADGGARFTGASEEEACPGLHDLEALCMATQRFFAGTADLAETNLLVRAGASLAGRRPGGLSAPRMAPCMWHTCLLPATRETGPSGSM